MRRRPPARETTRGSAPALLSCALACALTATAAAAAEPRKQLAANAWAGLEYDDNVTTAEVDTTSREGDGAAVFELGGSVLAYDRDETEIELGYDFYQSLHADLDDFDLRLHLPWVSLSREWHGVDWMFDYRYTNASLGDDRLYDVHALQPGVGVLLGDMLYATAAYGFELRDFGGDHDVAGDVSGRSAHRNELRLDAHLLFPAERGVASLGYRRRGEDADDRAFDYRANVLDASVRIALPMLLPPEKGRDPSAATLRYGYERRDYDRGLRDDRRHELRLGMEIPLIGPLRARAEYRHSSSDSTFRPADYRENAIGVLVGAAY